MPLCAILNLRGSVGALGNLIASSSSPSQDFNRYYHLKTLALISQTPFHRCLTDSFFFSFFFHFWHMNLIPSSLTREDLWLWCFSSQTHLLNLTVKTALKHLSSSGVNYQHVLSSTPSIRVRKAPQNRKIRHNGMLLGDERDGPTVFADNDMTNNPRSCNAAEFLWDCA